MYQNTIILKVTSEFRTYIPIQHQNITLLQFCGEMCVCVCVCIHATHCPQVSPTSLHFSIYFPDYHHYFMMLPKF